MQHNVAVKQGHGLQIVRCGMPIASVRALAFLPNLARRRFMVSAGSFLQRRLMPIQELGYREAGNRLLAPPPL